MRRVLLPLLLLPALLVACGNEGGDRAAAGGPTVVATTTQAADLARAVAGARARVTGLMAPNADPHSHELRPDDAAALADADVVVRSGGDLDAWLDDALAATGADAETLVLLDHVRAMPGDDGDPDPHWWHDPRNGVRAVEAIRAALTAADPAGARTYARNARTYTRRLEALDAAAARCLGRIPAGQRKLVTTHDALGYFADRYGFDVIGAVIPSRSTQAQASAGETTELIDTIRREGVRAVFAESSVSAKVERAIADAAGARLGEPLWADTLGPAGSPGATYLEALAANTRAIADGVSGGAVSCELPG